MQICRELAGFSAWRPHQLEEEMAQGTWIPARVPPDLLLGDADGFEQYVEVLGSLGGRRPEPTAPAPATTGGLAYRTGFAGGGRP